MSEPPSAPRGLLARLLRSLTPAPSESPAIKATRALLARLAEPLGDAAIADAVARPFVSVALPETDSLEPAELSALLELCASQLSAVADPIQASRLAVFCGILVEGGAPAGLVTRALAERLDLHNQALCAFLDEVGDVRQIEPHRLAFPQVYRTWHAARLLNMAVMTAFSRDLAGRLGVRQRPGFVARIDRIGSRVTNGVYVQQLFACADGTRLVLIHPAQARGFVLNANGVRNNFELWSLLEESLFRDGGLYDPNPQSNATSARLRYFEPYAWRDWPLALSTEAASLYGSGSASDFEIVAGELPVVLVAPSNRRDPWPKPNPASLHEAHEPQVDVERELTRTEVDQWLARCAEAGIGR